MYVVAERERGCAFAPASAVYEYNGTLFKVRTTVADSPRDQLVTHWSRVGGTHPLLLLIPSTSSKPKAGQHRKEGAH
jgi:hypothetical protein